MDPVVTVEGLRKAYGDVSAAADVTFEVERGEVFGMVGPNGAGKTTILECVSGLRRPDAGRAPLPIVGAAQLNPLYHAVTLLRGAWFGEPWSALAGSAAVVAGLLVVAAAFAAWRFRWDP